MTRSTFRPINADKAMTQPAVLNHADARIGEELNQQVHVAVGVRLASRHRAEHGKLLDVITAADFP